MADLSKQEAERLAGLRPYFSSVRTLVKAEKIVGIETGWVVKYSERRDPRGRNCTTESEVRAYLAEWDTGTVDTKLWDKEPQWVLDPVAVGQFIDEMKAAGLYQ